MKKSKDHSTKYRNAVYTQPASYALWTQ